ncbi:MAG: hypothetical protein J6Y85_00840 [Alphaproteobacteria bacterium]|nr:hypothetical protein [Alphaproteobacteria bacterium]
MTENNEKQANKSTQEARPNIQLDQYTKELHKIMAKSDKSADDVQQMKYLIEHKGAKLNGIGEDGQTLLEKAVRQSSVELFQFFRDHGANVNQVNGKLETPLHISTRLKNKSMQEEVLRSNPDVNAQDADGKTSLLIAVQQNDTDGITTLLAHNADPNKSAKGGEVPITEVADPEIAIKLVQNGAKVNVVTKQGEDAITNAETKGDKLLEIVLDAQLKEGQHIAAPNVDVEHKKETQIKQAQIVEQANGPVDNQLKSKAQQTDHSSNLDTKRMEEEALAAEYNVTLPQEPIERKLCLADLQKKQDAEEYFLMMVYNIRELPKDPQKRREVKAQLREKYANENPKQKLFTPTRSVQNSQKENATQKPSLSQAVKLAQESTRGT